MQSSKLQFKIKSFKKNIWEYYQKHGRKDLPWRKTTDPYHILASEIMLQQTQVSRVLQRYPEFLRAFPTFKSLANAPIAHILQVWQGMGYNRRVLYLKTIAKQVVHNFDGVLPQETHILKTFPGIGSNTAGAIAAFAFNTPIVFIETNIRRVFIHFFEALKEPMSAEANFRLPRLNRGDEFERRRISDNELLPLVKQTLDHKNPREWYFALMDYGAMLAKQKKNPNRLSRHYRKQSKFEGSNRQIRGKILRLFIQKHTLTEKEIGEELAVPSARIKQNLAKLEQEGFLQKLDRAYQLRVQT